MTVVIEVCAPGPDCDDGVGEAPSPLLTTRMTAAPIPASATMTSTASVATSPDEER
jgi:hypothetical protein